MDTTRDIIYRNYYLNDSNVAANIASDSAITGCVIDEFDPDDVDVVQFQEKRAEADGMDVGNPFYGGRRIHLAGTVYGASRRTCYDALMKLRAAMSPTLAQRESPADHGYVPMYFSIPTDDNVNFSGSIPMRALVMPKSFRAPIRRDQHGGASDNEPIAISWDATLLMRDPAFEGETPQDYSFADTVVVTGGTALASTDIISLTAHGLVAGDRIYFTLLTGGAGLALNTSYYVIASNLTANTFMVSTTVGGAAVNITTDYTNLSFAKFTTYSGNFNNRGTYNAPLNMIFSVGALAGTITVNAGGSQYTIAIPASTGTRIIRFKREKVITVEENGIERLVRSWLTFQNATTWPMIAAGPTNPYTVTVNGTTIDPGTTDGSHMWFWESYA